LDGQGGEAFLFFAFPLAGGEGCLLCLDRQCFGLFLRLLCGCAGLRLDFGLLLLAGVGACALGLQAGFLGLL